MYFIYLLSQHERILKLSTKSGDLTPLPLSIWFSKNYFSSIYLKQTFELYVQMLTRSHLHPRYRILHESSLYNIYNHPVIVAAAENYVFGVCMIIAMLSTLRNGWNIRIMLTFRTYWKILCDVTRQRI